MRDFIEAAHQRGIRVIADLVMNHTSSDHPWFQEARRARTPEARLVRVVRRPARATPRRGSSSPTPRRRTGPGTTRRRRLLLAPVLLPPAGPQLRQPRGPGGDARGPALLARPRAWTASGSTPSRTCTSATAPTARTCRRPTPTSSASGPRSTRRYPDRVLLAEANQWPADVVEYFGDGDECHMAFHFPVMPRMFMAVRREEANPIYEILAQTPGIPDNCQWGLFLRNHDELTLEMVTDEERDYMYAEYAKDPRMKINVGHPPAARPAAGRRPRRDRAAARDPVQPPGLARAVLRRRDHDGRQRLPRRPRRGADADAVDGRPQRRLQPRGLRAALRAAADGPAVRLPGRQRRGAHAHAVQPPALAAALHLAAQGAPGVRPRHLRPADAVQHRGSSPTSAPTRTT